MSTKPTTVADWTATGAITIPSAGKRITGFVVGENPPAQYFNWLHNLAGLWEKWLLDGDCDFHNLSTSSAGTLSIAGTSTFTGTATFSGLLVASLGINVPTGQSVALAGTTTLTVGGGATLTGGIANNVTLTLGATAAANQSFTVSGTGLYKRGNRTRHLSAFSFVSTAAMTWTNSNGGGFGMSNSTTYWAPLTLEQGETLTSLLLYYTPTASTSTFTVNLRRNLYNVGGATPASTILATANGFAGTNGAAVTIAGAGLPETGATTAGQYWLEVVTSASGAGGGTVNGFDIITTI